MAGGGSADPGGDQQVQVAIVVIIRRRAHAVKVAFLDGITLGDLGECAVSIIAIEHVRPAVPAVYE